VGIIDIIHIKLGALVLMTVLCIYVGLLGIKKKDNDNIYEYYCDSINQTNRIFT
jgi:hypothetical protein